MAIARSPADIARRLPGQDLPAQLPLVGKLIVPRMMHCAARKHDLARNLSDSAMSAVSICCVPYEASDVDESALMTPLHMTAYMILQNATYLMFLFGHFTCRCTTR